MRRVARSLAPLGALVLLATACSGGSGEPDAAPSAPPTPEPTSLAEVDTAALPVVRTAFCDSIESAQVEAALGGPVESTDHYANGERASLAPDVTDVAHENGCVFTGASDSGDVVARTWVFVPPVDADQAEQLAEAARADEDCNPVDGAAAYGEESVALVCRSGERRDRTVEISYRGLFGDAWLACSLQVPFADSPGRADLVARTDAWCLEAASAAAT
ncbi:hypothetical protein [uncultured Nocardioides sp.]|uniref:hypothetical protein n=1 Tax=uncultured Nocardioides sp. TaxID=198441 RepID=UPI0026168182|nr:hypothetical protein [uncultured Nocardioides sp.]